MRLGYLAALVLGCGGVGEPSAPAASKTEVAEPGAAEAPAQPAAKSVLGPKQSVDIPGGAEVLGVAPGGAAWALRLVLPVSELDVMEAPCPYPKVRDVVPASVSLALCAVGKDCQEFKVYDLLSCTDEAEAGKGLAAAKAAWTAAGVPWESPVAPFAATGKSEWSLPSRGLVIRQRWDELVQNLEFEKAGKTFSVQVDDFSETGLLSATYAKQIVLIPGTSQALVFREGACCGSPNTTTDVRVLDLDAVEAALAGG